MLPEPNVARTFLAALLRKDFDALATALAPTLVFRALVPGETVVAEGSAAAVGAFERWFADKEALELLAADASPVGDRLRFHYRVGLRRRGEPLVVEHWLCGDVEADRFVTLDLLCSGFRPAGAAPAEGNVHRFDAGDLGCATGLPREVRARLGQIPIGHRLAIATRDAAAREDLPALARLLGHRVIEVEDDGAGGVTIVVERAK